MRVIELRNVSYRRGDCTMVENVDLEIEAGTVTAILGPHGAGKKTLLALIAGEIAPTSGTIAFDGAPRLAYWAEQRARLDIHRLAAQRPRYVLLDESSRPQAMPQPYETLTLCTRLAHAGIGVVAIMHDLDLAAIAADRVLLMHAGQVVSIGAPEIVLQPSFLQTVYALPCAIGPGVQRARS